MLDAANPVEVDPEMDAIYPGRYAGILRVLLRDGRQFSKRVDYSRGMPEWPDGCGGAAVQVLLPGERRGGPGGDRACLRDAADGVYPARYGRARPHGGRLADAGVAVMKIGFIGLGTRGGGMAANLQHAQFSLTVHARRREAAEPFLTAGAAWAATPRELAARSDVVFICLPGPTEVEQVVSGPDGVLAGMQPGAALFDLTTNAPDMVRRLHAQFAERGALFFDAPVSRGPARSGQRQDGDLGWRRCRGLSALRARASRDIRSAAVSWPDRRRVDHQAREQLLHIHHHLRAGGNLRRGSARRGWSRWRCGRRCAGPPPYLSSDIRNPSICDTENPAISATVTPPRVPLRLSP